MNYPFKLNKQLLAVASAVCLGLSLTLFIFTVLNDILAVGDSVKPCFGIIVIMSTCSMSPLRYLFHSCLYKFKGSYLSYTAKQETFSTFMPVQNRREEKCQEATGQSPVNHRKSYAVMVGLDMMCHFI